MNIDGRTKGVYKNSKTKLERIVSEKINSLSDEKRKKFVFLNPKKSKDWGHIFRTKFPIVFDNLYREWLKNEKINLLDYL